MITILKLLRVHQWVKNAFIIFPLIFSGFFFDVNKLMDVFMTLWAFCCVASSVYILNDLLDFKRDKLHPKKKNRPLSSGTVTVSLAVILMISLALIGVLSGFWINKQIGCSIILYFILHLVYNLFAKNVVILDVFFIAFGFQLRIWAGSLAIGVLPSVWLQMCVLVLALFLGFTKRRYEISTLKADAASHRGVLSHYTSYLLDQIIIICSTLAIVFYSLYTISSDVVQRIGGHQMLYSAGFVIYGIFRYLYLIHVRKLGDDPGDILLSDKPLMINIFLWLCFVITLLYYSNMAL